MQLDRSTGHKRRRRTAVLAALVAGTLIPLIAGPAHAAEPVPATVASALTAAEYSAILASLNQEVAVYVNHDTVPRATDDQATAAIRRIAADGLAANLVASTASASFVVTSVERTTTATTVLLNETTTLGWRDVSPGSVSSSSYSEDMKVTLPVLASTPQVIVPQPPPQPIVQTAEQAVATDSATLSNTEDTGLEAVKQPSSSVRPTTPSVIPNKLNTAAYVKAVNQATSPTPTGSSEGAASDTADFSPPPGMDYNNEVAYAIHYSGNDSNGNGLQDHNYPTGGDDCTYFVSSVLKEAGWPTVGGYPNQHKDDSKWDYDMKGSGVDTYSWGSSEHLYNFGVHSNRTRYLDNVYNGQIGDLLFEDWDPNGQADGHIDHAQVYTGHTDSGEPTISQHSKWRQNIPVSMSISIAQNQEGKTKIVFYGLRD